MATSHRECPHCHKLGLFPERDPDCGDFMSCIFCGYEKLDKATGRSGSASSTPGIIQFNTRGMVKSNHMVRM